MNPKKSNIPEDAKQRMVADALGALKSDFKPMTLSSGELIQQRAVAISKEVAKLTRELDIAVLKAGSKHDVKTLVQIVSRKFLEGFSTWDKDELLYLLVMMHTDMAVDALTGNTETPRIIKPI